MPAGLKRFYGANHLHYLTVSCYRRRPLLGTTRRRDSFLKILEQVRQKYDFTIVGYVVMWVGDSLLPLNEKRVEWGTLKIFSAADYTARRRLCGPPAQRNKNMGSSRTL